MRTARKDPLNGTEGEVADKLEHISKSLARHEYVAGTGLRSLAAVLAQNPDLAVSVVTYENETQELEVSLADSPGKDVIIVDRNSAGSECQIALNRWLKIGSEPEIRTVARIIAALLSVCADPT